MAQATQQVAEKHEAEMKKLSVSANAPNLLTTTLLGKLPKLPANCKAPVVVLTETSAQWPGQ